MSKAIRPPIDYGHAARAILAETRPLEAGDPIEAVMHACGFPIGLPPTVRLHPRLPFTLGTNEVLGHHPAVVFPLSRGDGEIAAIEILYLGATGLAPVLEPWQTHWFSESISEGTFFQLSDETPGVVGVTVGITDAVAVLRINECLTVCAVQGCEGLEAFDWPGDTLHIDVYATDQTEAAGHALAARAIHAGLTAAVLMPATPGASWFQELAFAGAIPCDDQSQAKADAARLDDNHDDERQ
ncbi:hypothetical protein [Aquabacterium sp. CECT 9606]|uniref:DUF7146 domain-containing protein n=1 Tax=Aquabacterium sp. CECT 9606 TaxID=2845822 RepID=UPI001E2E5A9C|nr:hypothetical protein [Aquabacterium sp. CECT 9606]CAH0354059.1 hypothetical protein AQB9606_03454 [Aquabacterium sp. CECT 9606]